MRKLAIQSKETVVLITTILKEMRQSVQEIISDVDNVGNIAENQAAATQEITAAIQEVSNNSQTLAELSKIR